MPSYPTEITAIRSAMQAWSPPTEIVDDYGAAISYASAVQQVVSVFDLLKAQESLDADGDNLLKGCAHLISANSWFGKAEEALAVLTV